MSDPGPRRDCIHQRVHHQHGTRAAYVADHCHCGPCTQANRAAGRTRRRAMTYGTWSPYRSGSAAARHIRRLIHAGVTITDIADAADLARSTVTPSLPDKERRPGTCHHPPGCVVCRTPPTAANRPPPAHFDTPQNSCPAGQRMSRAALPAASGCAAAVLAVVAAPLILFAGCQETRTPIAAPQIDLTNGVSDGFGQLSTAAVPDADWVPWIEKAGQLCPEIPAALIAAQIDTESSWRPEAESDVGAHGLAQFMPATWADTGRDDDGNGTASPFDPGDAIMAQGRYMCGLVAQASAAIANGTLPGQDPVMMALAGYNAGFNRVLQYQGVPPFPETQAYIPKILTLAVSTYSTPGTVATPGGGTAVPVGPAGPVNAAILAAALPYSGFPYVWAGGSLAGPTGTDVKDGRGPGFDCSGLVRYAVYKGTGGAVELPRVSRDQGKPGRHMTPIPRDQAQPGDIIAFKFDNRNGGAATDWDHIGIISGPSQMFNAPSSGRNLGYADLTRPFYANAPQQVFRVTL